MLSNQLKLYIKNKIKDITIYDEMDFSILEFPIFTEN